MMATSRRQPCSPVPSVLYSNMRSGNLQGVNKKEWVEPSGVKIKPKACGDSVEEGKTCGDRRAGEKKPWDILGVEDNLGGLGEAGLCLC